jgi:2',3'-cyclic-nucleotide 2'-phosphodiesterase (5'-nucleotidase family)
VFNEPKSHFIARMMGEFGYDAVALGEKELGYGLEKIIEDNDRYSLNVICANLMKKTSAGKGRRPSRRDDRTVFPAHRIIKRGGVKIGVFALLSPSTKARREGTAGMEDLTALTYVLKDPIPIAAGLVPSMRKKCDIVLLLAHMDQFDLEKLLAEVPDIDLVILGHHAGPTVTREPVLVDSIPVYMASHQGQYMGRLTLTLDERRVPIDYQNRITLLEASVPDDPDVVETIQRFEEENRSIQKEMFAHEQLKDYASQKDTRDTYLGVGVCQRCHAEAFDIYTHTRHARAYATLSAQFKHRDSGCIPCHSTGYDVPGGFSGLRRIGDTIDLVDVQCEACHGPGSEHSRDGRYLETAKKICKTCHTKEQDPEFEFSRAWEKIAH